MFFFIVHIFYSFKIKTNTYHTHKHTHFVEPERLERLFHLMAVIALGVTLDTVHATSAARTCVAFALRTPSDATRHPAYLRLAHRTL